MENVYRYLYGMIWDRLSDIVACKGLHARLMNFMILCIEIMVFIAVFEQLCPSPTLT